MRLTAMDQDSLTEMSLITSSELLRRKEIFQHSQCLSERELVGAMEKSQMRRRSKITSSDHRSMHHTSSHLLGDSYTVYYMCNLLKNSEGDNPLEDWSIFYCGGSSKMKDDLKAISKKYTIDLSVEKFDW